MHRWLWQDRLAAEAAMLAVFRDYAHVYNAKLEEVPRDLLTAEWMASSEDPAFLLASKRYEFPTLHTGLFAEQGGYLPPAASPRLRGSQAGAEIYVGAEDDDDAAEEAAVTAESEDATDEAPEEPMLQKDDQEVYEAGSHGDTDDADLHNAVDDPEQIDHDDAAATGIEEQEKRPDEDDDNA